MLPVKHIEKINQVIEEALKEADVTLDDLDAIGVTYGPGLVGALLGRRGRSESNCICAKNFRWWVCIILKDMFRQIILNIRIWNRRFCV